MSGRKLVDMTGERFGRATIIKYAGKDKHNLYLWECKCDCGTVFVTTGNALRTGRTKSCGCLQKEIASKTLRDYNESPRKFTKGHYKHGDNKTRLHSIWCGMRRRCRENNKHYGARGISVCKEWEESYLSFKKWALENGYEETLSIDRIDNNGNYEPSNCRWVTQTEQCRNRRNTVYLTLDGIAKPLSQWCEEKSFDYKLAIGRYEKGFMPDEIFADVGSVIHPPATRKAPETIKKRRSDVTPEVVCALMNNGISPYRIAKSVLHTDFETVRERIMRCDPDLLPDKWKKKVLEYHAK